jgi:tRNA (guanine9-N1)-methyltransferase
MGAASWPLNKHRGHFLDHYPPELCTVLSPDADTPLLQLAPERVYIIGGIVDRSVKKGLTLGVAERYGLEVVRLPVSEFASELGLGGAGDSNRPVLNVSDVVVALVEYQRTGDWVQALKAAIPHRKRQ